MPNALYDPLDDLTKKEIERIDYQNTTANFVSVACCVLGICTSLVNPKKRKFPNNVQMYFMIAALLFHFFHLFGVFVGYEEIREEGTLCIWQGALITFTSVLMLTLVALMNFNLYKTIYQNDSTSIIFYEYRYKAVVVGLPLICAAAGIPAYGVEIAFCWVPIGAEIYWTLITTLGSIIIYLFVGSYWWSMTLLKIYRIHRQVMAEHQKSHNDQVIVFTWIRRFKRQLIWIFVNLYIFLFIIIGSLIYSGRDSIPYNYQSLFTVNLALIGTAAFAILYTTSENYECWKAFFVHIYNRFILGKDNDSSATDNVYSSLDDPQSDIKDYDEGNVRSGNGSLYHSSNSSYGTDVNNNNNNNYKTVRNNGASAATATTSYQSDGYYS